MAVKKWRGKWVVDLKIDGRRVRRVSPDQSKAGARRYEAALLSGSSIDDSYRGLVDEPVGVAEACPTLAEFAPEWLVTYAVPNNKPSERHRKEMILRVHIVPFFGKRRLDEITLRHVEGFKAHQIRKGLMASTINSQLSVLQRLLRTAVEWGVMPRREGIWKIRKLREPEPEFDWLKPEEAGALLTAAKELSPKWHAFFFVALRTGMRKGEIMGLHWKEVDFARRRIVVKYTNWQGILGTPKSGKTRMVPMTGDLIQVLADWRTICPGKVVFPGKSGGLSSGQAIPSRQLRRALSRAGLRRIRFHDLRHTFASHLVLKRCSLREVQLLMGHASIKMTERYAHIAEGHLSDVIGVLDGLGLPDESGT